MPIRRLPSHPSLEHLKHQAKDLIKAHAAQAPPAAQLLREFHPQFSRATDAEIFATPLFLSAAQLAIARQSGFPSWQRLKAHIEEPASSNRPDLPHHERITDPLFRRAVSLLDAGDANSLRALLQQHPRLVRQQVVFEGENYFRNPTLLEFIAENPIRHGKLPANIVSIAQIILDAGADLGAKNETLVLVSTGRIARETRMQLPLIALLCDSGARPSTALRAAAAHGEFEAVDALLQRGALLDLPIAAALGRIDDFRRLLSNAAKEDCHLALALAAQLGRIDIVRILLDAGEDPNRYDPIGAHSHATPLHQAAFAGNESLVDLLIAHGASVDMRDLLWHGTPADWAQHAGKTALEVRLRALEAKADGH